MYLVKTLDKKKIGLILIFVLVYLLARLPNLARETINPDAVNWHYRSEQFIVGLKHQQFFKTYQHYHPGVTLTWLIGIPVELFKQLSGIELYDQYSFYSFHLVAKLSLVFSQLALHLILLYLLAKIYDFNKALVFSVILSLEPFFLGNSRLLHMDTLFSLLILITLSFSYLYLQRRQTSLAVFAGIFAGLTFLTRSIGLGLILYIAFGTAFYMILESRSIKNLFKYFGVVFLASIVTTFLLFPALWQTPISVLKDIFSEGERVGIRNGHTQIFFSKETENPGLLFYPVVILLKTSPFIMLGIAISMLNTKFSKIKDIFKGKLSFELFSFIFYLGYFIVMSLPTKKIDRYMLVIIPFLGLVAVNGYFGILSKKFKGHLFYYASLLLFVLFVLIPVISYSPYNFTYTNPFFRNAQAANNIVGQKSFGVGIFEVKEHMQNKYGSNIRVGFIDTKPIKQIYSNSLVSDIRIEGTSSYDVIVLAVNEEIPEKVLKSEVNFVKDSSIFINGLEYWRFYVKDNR